MSVHLRLPDDALSILRPLFIELEGDCEAWEDEEIVRRMIIRGAMDYAKAVGRPWDEVAALAGSLRSVW